MTNFTKTFVRWYLLLQFSFLRDFMNQEDRIENTEWPSWNILLNYTPRSFYIITNCLYFLFTTAPTVMTGSENYDNEDK